MSNINKPYGFHLTRQSGSHNVLIGHSAGISNPVPTESALQNKYPDLRKLGEQYYDLLSKYRTFEIIKQENK